MDEYGPEEAKRLAPFLRSSRGINVNFATRTHPLSHLHWNISSKFNQIPTRQNEQTLPHIRQKVGPSPNYNHHYTPHSNPNITLYFLQTSRAIRTAWLLEELNLPYNVHYFDREPSSDTPASYREEAAFAAGRSPAIRDGELGIVESGEWRVELLLSICAKPTTPPTIVLFSGSRPQILPLAPGRLERTTLGKLSRAKVKASLLRGDYQDQVDIDTQILQEYRVQHAVEPRNATEQRLMDVFRDLDLGSLSMGIDTPILDTGVSSVDLIRLKRASEKAFQIPDIPIITIITNTTIRTLATAIECLQTSQDDVEVIYNPVITLQPNGSKTPLWLVHPGIGEMLVFLGLVQYFPDRPIYAMRARGLNSGEESFSGLEEIITSYHRAMKEKQPHGPYAIAGYSYGGMLAFEITKILEKDADHVQFLGSFNLPPHIKTRMQRLDWTAGMVHIAHFCSIITEQRSEELVFELRPLAHDEQVALLLAASDQQRCTDLALTHAGLLNWTDVSWSLQKIGWQYDPSRDVSHMDIFYCQPLKDVASTREEYRKDHLNHWVSFIRDDLNFWEVDGQYYTMIGPDHVPKFQQTLKKALTARGL